MSVFPDEIGDSGALVVNPETGEVIDTMHPSDLPDSTVAEPEVAGSGGQTIHRAIVDTMDDVALVIDEEWNLVYANPSAREYTQASLEQLRGTPVTRLTSDLIATEADRERFESALSSVFAADPDCEFPRVVDIEFDLPVGEVVAEYKLSPFPDRETTSGAIIVARDITERRARERDLEHMRQLQSRVLRHNIRNDLNVVRGYAEMFAEEFDGEYGDMAESVLETTDNIVSVSEKTRTIEQLIRQDQSTVSLDTSAVLQTLVDEHRSRFPGVSFTLDTPEASRVETVEAIELAFENLVENAAEHTDSTVQVTLRETDDSVVVTVSDDGPGIPEQELAVRERGWETPLEHGAGLGLWVVEWLTKVSAVSVTYETTGNGTDAYVYIPREQA